MIRYLTTCKNLTPKELDQYSKLDNYQQCIALIKRHTRLEVGKGMDVKLGNIKFSGFEQHYKKYGTSLKTLPDLSKKEDFIFYGKLKDVLKELDNINFWKEAEKTLQETTPENPNYFFGFFNRANIYGMGTVESSFVIF